MTQLELDDIQGYLLRGYAHMMYSRFVFLQVKEAAAVKNWLARSWNSFTTAQHVPKDEKICDNHLNIAFTNKGLLALGLKQQNLDEFSVEFREGMVTPHRTRLLGDFGSSSPDNWQWGVDSAQPIHIALMVFGRTDKTCLDYYEELKSQFGANGLKEVLTIDGQTLPQNKEHFGFRDGISQPIIEGSGRKGPENDYVKAGEFVFGYKNEYGVYPDTPLIASEQGELNLLAADAEGSGRKDLGRNGTFMVMRQLQQDVEKFWDFMNNNTRNDDGSINEKESIKLAAKMMGRWPSGAPLTKYPDQDPGTINDDNNFGYAKNDEEGLKCPFGSHIRRTNPRDSFEDNKIKLSLSLSNKHRIIRRARLYGDPFEGSPLHRTPKGEVGLLFSCFNADISRQFEFLQYTWINNPKVSKLYNDPDPIMGVSEEKLRSGLEQNFTIQELPVSRTVKKLESFVTVKGGGYFFLPSISAVRYLSTL